MSPVDVLTDVGGSRARLSRGLSPASLSQLLPQDSSPGRRVAANRSPRRLWVTFSDARFNGPRGLLDESSAET